MNDFFKKKQTVFFFICCGLCIGAILIRYAKLAMLPVSASSPAREIVERGSIVDRSGFPLAVQTNFYHVGVTLRNIRDNKKVKEAFTSDVAPLLNMSESEINELLNTKKSLLIFSRM